MDLKSTGLYQSSKMMLVVNAISENFMRGDEPTEKDMDVLFCSMDCMKNPAKFIEFIRTSTTTDGFIEEKKLCTVVDYFSKDSHDISILIEFITRINKEYGSEFNLNMEDIKVLLKNQGGFLLVKKNKGVKETIKDRIYLRPIELKTI